MIAEAAYFLAESRGFAPGAECEDWLGAEAQIDNLFRLGFPKDQSGPNPAKSRVLLPQ